MRAFVVWEMPFLPPTIYMLICRIAPYMNTDTTLVISNNTNKNNDILIPKEKKPLEDITLRMAYIIIRITKYFVASPRVSFLEASYVFEGFIRNPFTFSMKFTIFT